LAWYVKKQAGSAFTAYAPLPTRAPPLTF